MFKTVLLVGGFVVAVLGVQLVASSEVAKADVVRWVGPLDDTGDWSDPTNWSPQQVPGVGDSVVIDSGGLFARVNLDIDVTVAGLTLDFLGRLQGPGNLTVTGLTTWIDGDASGLGTLRAEGGLVLTGSYKNIFQPIHNAGLAVWDSGTVRISGSRAEFRNLAGALFDARNDGLVMEQTSRPFINLGTFVKSGGSAQSFIGTPFDNSGIVEVQTGTLTLARGGLSTGDFKGAGRLDLAGEHTISGDLIVNSFETSMASLGPGTDVKLHGQYDVSQFTTVGGTVEFTADSTLVSLGTDVHMFSGLAFFNTGGPVTLPNLTLSGGSLQGSDDVTVAGPLEWTGGSMWGEGTTTAAGGLTMGGNKIKNLCRTLINSGSGVWHGVFGSPSTLQMSCATNPFVGEFNNEGSFDLRADHLVIGGVINNSGTFTKSAGTGVAQILSVFNNSGTVDVKSGTLLLWRGGTAGSTFTGSGTLALAGTHDLGDSTVTVAELVIESGHTTMSGPYTNTGVLEVKSSATLAIENGLIQTAGTTVIDGALISPTVDIQGGTLTGSGTINGEPVNQSPTADSLEIEVEAGVPSPIVLTGSDPDDDEITFIVQTPPTNGTLHGEAPNLAYRSNRGHVGRDSFTFITNDGTLNSLAATVIVTVVDTTAPSWSLPSDITEVATGLEGAAVNYNATATDYVGVVSSLCTPPSGATFPVGTTTVDCTASDAAGNIGSATFDVTVLASVNILIAEIEDLGLDQGVEKSLLGPLETIEELVTDGDPDNDTAACKLLDVFTRIVVKHHDNGSLTQTDADALTAFAQALHSQYNC